MPLTRILNCCKGLRASDLPAQLLARLQKCDWQLSVLQNDDLVVVRKIIIEGLDRWLHKNKIKEGRKSAIGKRRASLRVLRYHRHDGGRSQK